MNPKYGKHIITLFSACILLFTGCGNENLEMENYKSNMNQFFDNVAYYDNVINSIDPNSETAVSELLSQLDSIKNTFSQMAALEVPSDFAGVEELADDADEYMMEAVSLYHQAFESEIYDVNIGNAAKENYDRANLRIRYILSILHGEIPEEIYVTDDDTTEETHLEDDMTEDMFSEDDTAVNELPEDENINESEEMVAE